MVYPRRPTDDERAEDREWQRLWQEHAATPEGQAWLQAVHETASTWGYPASQAEQIMLGLIAETDFWTVKHYVQKHMPEWQQIAEQRADLTVNAITLGLLSYPTIRRLAEAIRDRMRAGLRASGDEEEG